MKPWTASVFALALWLPLSAAEPQDSTVRVAALQFRDNPKKVMEGHGANGSGTCVGHQDGGSLILTNRHVAPDDKWFYFVRIGEKIEPAWWIAADDQSDLALLWIKVKVPTVEIAASDPKPDTLVKQWGYPGNGPVDAKQGKVFGDKYTDARDGYEPLVANFGIRPGDSGAGVFAEGKLAGVCYGGHWDDATGIAYPPAFCVRLKDVRRFVDKFAR